MDKLAEVLASEWAILSEAPFAFLLLALAMFGAAYAAARWRYTSIIESLRTASDTLTQRLHLRAEQAEQYRERVR